MISMSSIISLMINLTKSLGPGQVLLLLLAVHNLFALNKGKTNLYICQTADSNQDDRNDC